MAKVPRSIAFGEKTLPAVRNSSAIPFMLVNIAVS
jgi:hypothetical protein